MFQIIVVTKYFHSKLANLQPEKKIQNMKGLCFVWHFLEQSLCRKRPSSNVNEIIRAISNLFIFFYEKILHVQKAQKAQRRNQAKAQKA